MGLAIKPYQSLVARLQCVRSELEQDLLHARQAIEQHAESTADPLLLERALACLQEVRSVAMMIQASGVALLAEEMRQTTRDLADGRAREPQAAYSALVGACVQVGDYLDLLAGGQDDSVLVLQPLINELRLARGKSLLTEDDLFVAQFGGAGPQLPMPERAPQAPAPESEAARLSPVFAAALLSWFKDKDAAQSLARIGRICELLAEASQHAPMQQLWRIGAACAEGLLSRALDSTLELKRQFGRAGQLMKRIAELGEAEALGQLSDVALRMLFFVGRSRASGPRVAALREQLDLARWLPDAETVQARRTRLRGPGTSLLLRVAEEVRADLAEVKDSIDVALRAAGAAGDFEDTRARLQQVADTLMVLGLSEQSLTLAEPLETLRDAGGPQPASQAAWMEFATAVLQVELSLDGALYRQIQTGPRQGESAPVAGAESSAVDLRAGTAALLRESLVNLTHVKATIEQYLRKNQDAGLAVALRQLGEIAAGLRVLGQMRAGDAAAALCERLASPELAGVRQSRRAANQLADAIVALEFYLELQRDGLPGADTVLDDLTQRLAAVDLKAEDAAQPGETAPRGEAWGDQGLVIPPEPEPPAAYGSETQSGQAGTLPAPEPPLAAADVDPEIREIFLGEAAEVLETLNKLLPRWLREPADREHLHQIRRAFHTLKGSGQMVAAHQIGEFAYAIEHLLNRCLDAAVAISPALVDLVREAVTLMPGLVEAFRMSIAPPVASAQIVDRARLLASGRPAPAPGEMIEVFRKDAREHLQAVGQWVQRQDRGAWDYEVPANVVRAFHTLRGSAQAVGAQAVAALSGALESYLDMLAQSQLPLAPAGLGLIDESLRAMQGWVERLGQDRLAEPDPQPWLERVEAVRSGLSELPDMPSEDERRLLQVFALEALDLVQAFEAELTQWSRTPGAVSTHARALGALAHRLHGAASMAHGAPIAAVAQALNLRLADMETGASPAPAFFTAIAPILEALYGMLDAFREGRLTEDGEEIVEQVRALAELPSAPAVLAPAVSPAPADAAQPDPQLVAVFLQEADELLDEIDRLAEPVARNPADPAVLGDWLRALHTLKGSARLTGMPGIGELAHRLETLSEQALRQDPSQRPLFRERVLLAVEGLHRLLDGAQAGVPPDATPVLLQLEALQPAPVAQGSDGSAQPLHEAPVEDVFEMPAVFESEAELGLMDEAPAAAQGSIAQPGVSAEPLPTIEGLELLDFAPGPGAGPAPIDVQAPAVFEPAGVELPSSPLEIPEFSTPPTFAPTTNPQPSPDAPEAPLSTWESRPEKHGAEALAPIEPLPAELPLVLVPTAADSAPTPESVDGAEVDPELAAIFAAEAAELIESLSQSLAAWRNDARDAQAPQAMQRALHTLKGGARVAGFAQLGDSAHALETRIAQVVSGPWLPELPVFQGLAQDLEGLQRQQEEILRREPVPVSAAATAASPAVQPPAPGENPPGAGPEPATGAPAASSPTLASGWNPELFWKPDSEDAAAAALRRETARVPVDRLDAMLNQAGEIAIYRSRLEENHAGLGHTLDELSQTLARVREQLRMMDIETEAQIAARGFSRPEAEPAHRYEAQFDALEMDRYSRMQELSRALAESLSDLGSLHAALDTSASESETLLQQQGRINTELQQGLMSKLMVPFSRQIQRLSRVVRQTAEQNGKRARAEFEGADAEMDRSVLERMTAPLEHLLRNSVVHGIEDPAARTASGKDAEGMVRVSLKREGSQLLIEVRDDGRGLDYAAIRAQAVKRGLIASEARVAEDELARYIFAPGFSTARLLTQDAGRGIGMDVVASEVKQLGGSVDLGSEAGLGTRFRIRLPLMLAVAQALVVQLGEELYALPLTAVEGITRTPRESLAPMDTDPAAALRYGGREYTLRRLSDLVGLPADARNEGRTVPAILLRLADGLGGAERRIAVLVDRLIGNREIVSKAAGPILGSVPGITGATLTADGRVMLILDLPALIRESEHRGLAAGAAGLRPVKAEEEAPRPLIMVVDDSITIRRVTERLLLRKGYRVLTARDGLDAMAQLQSESPAAILLDIEMPRADGFEVAAFVRNNGRIAATPIVMITSRSGDKHREHARQLGVDRYLIKPFQEDQLLAELGQLVGQPESLA